MTRASEELEEREMIMPLLAVVKSELATLRGHLSTAWGEG
jgi:hypothetical protein